MVRPFKHGEISEDIKVKIPKSLKERGKSDKLNFSELFSNALIEYYKNIDEKKGCKD